MKKRLLNILICLTLIGLGGCASIINSTGQTAFSSDIKNISLVCWTPDNVKKFSMELCASLKQELKQSGIEATTKVISEMDPSLSSGSSEITTDQQSDLVMTINHIRVSLYNGQPSNTLLNIELLDPKENKKIWAARIYTKGSNITGPGNPEKVATEIMAQMKVDGLKI
ncbi:MAG: hypothetical protein CMC96_02455 [Flavobacteriales bacterium]|nr:hypothetical protein [Flavobacteriales bacterium]|tara:strand:- start:2525 stop:3031 length:507 start_codon:yes stop_codon:yes gene_type:complete